MSANALGGGGGGAVRLPETLSRGERAAWRVQGMFRRWSILFGLNAISALWLGFGDANARNFWNFTWSALAVNVEFVTALALVSLARRDHDSIDEVKMSARRIEKIEENVLAIVDHLQVELEERK